jgi:ubiquinone/menaquinone biosynthesis C-methylase UbiE
MKKEIAEKILKETEAGYDLISGKFSQTRKYFWRGLEFIADFAKTGDKVLDFGCGNGRLLELFLGKNVDYLGVDVSEKLIDIAKNKYPDKANNLQKISSSDSLPLPDNSFNVIYSIAVFHHFPSEEYRRKIADELHRIAKKDGCVVITAWNLYQKKYLKNILKNWFLKIIGKSDLDWNDCYISFKDNQGIKIQRFHHAFTKRELRKLFSQAGFEIEKCDLIGGRNILLVAKKKG